MLKARFTFQKKFDASDNMYHWEMDKNVIVHYFQYLEIPNLFGHLALIP